MSRLIKKYLKPSSSLDYWSLFESKDIDGIRYYKFIDPVTGIVKWVNPEDSKVFPNGQRGYPYLTSIFKPSGRYTAVSNDPNVGGISLQDVEVLHLYDRYNADLAAERLTGGLENYITPWGIAGTTFNAGMGLLMQALPESVLNVLSNFRYIDPVYGIDILRGLNDLQILNGEGLTGTPTGTALSLFTVPTLYGKAIKGLKATPYLAGKYGGNTALGNWGRGYTVSRMMNNSMGDLYNPGALYDAAYKPLQTPSSMFPAYMSRATGQYVAPPTIERTNVTTSGDVMGSRRTPTTAPQQIQPSEQVALITPALRPISVVPEEVLANPRGPVSTPEVVPQSTSTTSDLYTPRPARVHYPGTENMFQGTGLVPMREDIVIEQLRQLGVNPTRLQVRDFLTRHDLAEGYRVYPLSDIDFPVINGEGRNLLEAREELSSKFHIPQRGIGSITGLNGLEQSDMLRLYLQARREAYLPEGTFTQPITEETIPPVSPRQTVSPESISAATSEDISQAARPIRRRRLRREPAYDPGVLSSPRAETLAPSWRDAVSSYLSDSGFTGSDYLDDAGISDFFVRNGLSESVANEPYVRRLLKEVAEEKSLVDLLELLTRGGIDPEVAKTFAERHAAKLRAENLLNIRRFRNMMRSKRYDPDVIEQLINALSLIYENTLGKRSFATSVGPEVYVGDIKNFLSKPNRTRVPGETPYTLEEVKNMFDENGNIKGEWGGGLDYMESGSHGVANWPNSGDTPSDILRKYLSAKFPEDNQNNLNIATLNFDGSGIYIPDGLGGHFSLDSARLLMGMIARRLSHGRNLYRPEGIQQPHGGALNRLGMVNRYNSDLNPEILRAIKDNRDVIRLLELNESGEITHNGNVVGKFTEKTPTESLAELNRSVDLVNNILRNKYRKSGIAEEELANQYYLNPFTYSSETGKFYLPNNLEGSIMYKGGGKTKRLVKRPNLSR